MTDETTVSDTQTSDIEQSQIDSNQTQSTPMDEHQAEVAEEQKQPDTEMPQHEQTSADLTEQPAIAAEVGAAAEETAEVQDERTHGSNATEKSEVSEQIPAAEAVDSDNAQPADDAAVSQASTDVELPAPAAESTDDSINPLPSAVIQPSTDAEVPIPAAAADPTDAPTTPLSSSVADTPGAQPTNETATADADPTPSSINTHSIPQQPTSPTAIETTTNNILSDTDSSFPSSTQPAVAKSSDQLVSTVPAALSPRNQPAPTPRESTIEVRLLLPSSDEPVVVSVHITRDYLSQPKPFLGGYRHHLSGRVKHHAAVQTERRQTGKGGRERVSRDSQTVETATRSAQSGRSVGTQMARKDYYIGEEGETGQGERVVIPGEYVSSDVLEAQREERAKQIQCWLRVCFALRRMKQLKAAKDSKESSERQATEAAADRRRREEEQQIHRRMHPKSKEDFTLLYAELNAWRQHEAARIHTLELSDEDRDTQLSALLSKEVKLLQTIDRLKIRAGKERKEEGIHRRLEMMQSPKEWATSAGHHVEVVTPYTVRAQELTSLYQALLLPVQMHAEEKEADSVGALSGCLTWEGRVDVLLHCKYVVGEMASQLSADILQLIEREQEWVRRRHATPGWHAEQALAGMRKRLAALFLQFVQTPAYNPEAAVYVDSVVGREGKQKMQELLKKPLAEREMRKRRPIEEGQDRVLITRVQT